MDYALNLFATGMAGLAAALWQFIPPQVIARARFQILLWQTLPGGEWLLPSLIGGGLLAVAALLMAAAVFARRPLQGPR
jgi:hypothetical protein